VDESFLNALEYGRKFAPLTHRRGWPWKGALHLLTFFCPVPPTGGWGLGIDRLAMVRQNPSSALEEVGSVLTGCFVTQFITNNYSIREVLAFPFLREDKTAPKEKFAAEVVDVQPLPEEGIRE